MARRPRYFQPGVLYRVRREVLNIPETRRFHTAVDAVLAKIRHTAAEYGVEVHAVTVQATAYEMLATFSEARAFARFLCVLNRAIALLVRASTWSGTLWRRDRPTIELVTDEPVAQAIALESMAPGAPDAIVVACETGHWRAQPAGDTMEVPPPLPLLAVVVERPPALRCESRAVLAQWFRKFLRVRRRASKWRPGLEGVPGTESFDPCRMHPVLGYDPDVTSALHRRWLTFQRLWADAADRLAQGSFLAAFPRHAFPPPLATAW